MTFDDALCRLKTAILTFREENELERAGKLEDLRGSLIAYGRKHGVLSHAEATLQDCIRALRAHGLPETAEGLVQVLRYLQASTPPYCDEEEPTSEPPEGLQRMQEVDAAQAKNLKHLTAARNALHRVGFIGLGPDGMRTICDMLDDIDHMIKHLTPEEPA